MNTRDYWRAAKKALGNCSDYALSKRIKITRSSGSLLANGHSVMSVTTAAKLAEIVGVDQMKAIADAELERGINDADFWKRVAKRVAFVGGAAAGAALLYQAAAGGDAQLAIAIVAQVQPLVIM